MPVFLILSNWKEKKISTLFNQISLIFSQYFIRKRRIQGFFEFIHWIHLMSMYVHRNYGISKIVRTEYMAEIFKRERLNEKISRSIMNYESGGGRKR